MSVHLDRARLAALLAGELSAVDEAALAAHLASGCEACAEALAALPAEDERLLLAALARAEAAPAAGLPAGAIARALPRPTLRLLAFFSPLAAAAAALLLWLAWPAPPAPGPDGQRIKGPEALPEISLGLGVATRDAHGEPRVERLGPGARVPARGSLVFQLSTRVRCHLGLARLGPDQAIEILLPEAAGAPLEVDPGVHTPSLRGESLGLQLSGLRGRQAFVATCSAAPLELPAALAPLARALAEGQEAAELPFAHALFALEVEGAP